MVRIDECMTFCSSRKELLTCAPVIRKITGNWDFLRVLTTVPSSEETEDERKIRLGLEAIYNAEIMVKMQGRSDCAKWCRQHKGKCLLTHFSDSDKAYGKTSMKDRGGLYRQEFEMLEGLTDADKQKYKEIKKSKAKFEESELKR